MSDNFPTAQQRIAEQLLKLLGPVFPLGSRLPPVDELARRLGTAHRNTHGAVRALAQQGYLISKQRLGTYVAATLPARAVPGPVSPRALPRPALETSPHLLPSEDAPLAGKRIAMLTYATRAPEVYHLITAGLMQRLQQAGAVIWEEAFTQESSDMTPRCTDDVDALVLMFPSERATVRFDQRKVVLIYSSSRVMSIQATSRFDLLALDEEQAGILAGQYARQLGAQRPTFVGIPGFIDGQYDDLCQIRLAGFEDGFGQRLPAAQRLQASRYTPESGARAARLLVQMETLPDFVFTATDDVAMGLMMGCAANGLAPGKDFLLLGMDGHPAGRTIEGGPLSTIARNDGRMAELGAQYLTERLLNPDTPSRRTLVGARLFVGATTEPAWAAQAATEVQSPS